MVTRTFLVTGATKGIGKAVTELLLADGHHVVGLARTRPSSWEGRFITCDVTDANAVSTACDEISQIEDLWGLVNNAGIGHADSLAEISLDDMQRVFIANTIAPALITQAAVVPMRSGGAGGRIINICSNVALGKVERSSYGASKAALASLTRTWALELASQQITVNAVSPGPVETELFRGRNPAGSPQALNQLNGIPDGRFGQPGEVASLVAYFASEGSAHCTGQIIYLDGGASVGRALL